MMCVSAQVRDGDRRGVRFPLDFEFARVDLHDGVAGPAREVDEFIGKIHEASIPFRSRENPIPSMNG